MKRNYWINALSLLAFLSALSANVNGTVIVDDAAFTIRDTASGVQQILTLTKSIPSGQGLFNISIAPVSPSELQFSPLSIAEEYKLFAVDQDIPFDSNYVLSNTPIVWSGLSSFGSRQEFSINQVKYFGYWDDRYPANHVPDSYDNYGWVSLIRTASGLEVLSSATSIGSGIYVGSLTQVPLPLPAGLFVSGLIFLSGHSRKRRSSQS